jgi:quinol-cytochrome oxidoreductase complex cytochrome b subunit
MPFLSLFFLISTPSGLFEPTVWSATMCRNTSITKISGNAITCNEKKRLSAGPYYSVKDIVGVVVFLMIFSAVVFFAPAMNGYFQITR